MRRTARDLQNSRHRRARKEKRRAEKRRGTKPRVASPSGATAPAAGIATSAPLCRSSRARPVRRRRGQPCRSRSVLRSNSRSAAAANPGRIARRAAAKRVEKMWMRRPWRLDYQLYHPLAAHRRRPGRRCPKCQRRFSYFCASARRWLRLGRSCASGSKRPTSIAKPGLSAKPLWLRAPEAISPPAAGTGAA